MIYFVWTAAASLIVGYLAGYAVGLYRGQKAAAAKASAYGAIGAMAYTEAQKKLAERAAGDKDRIDS